MDFSKVVAVSAKHGRTPVEAFNICIDLCINEVKVPDQDDVWSCIMRCHDSFAVYRPFDVEAE